MDLSTLLPFSKPPSPLLSSHRTLLLSSPSFKNHQHGRKPIWKKLNCSSKHAVADQNCAASYIERQLFDDFPQREHSSNSQSRIVEPKFEMSLSELIQKIGIGPVLVRGDPEVLVSGIKNDSREINPGDLFVCCAGYKTDGHLYISEAIERGAVAVVATAHVNVGEKLGSTALVLVEDTNLILSILAATFYQNPSKKLSVIGITGTNGKTTTSHLVKAILEASGTKTGMLGSVAYHVCGNHQLEAPNTTPDAVTAQKLMAKMVHNGTKATVMEVSSIGLAVGRCDEIHFDVAVFMNLTRDHHDFHKTEEEYRNCKAKLFRKMVNPLKHRKIANIDDQNAPFFIAQGNPDVPVVTFGLENKEADVYPLKIELSLLKTWVAVKTPKGVLEISSNSIGRFNVYNILAAVSVGIAVGVPMEDIVRGIEGMNGVPGRFELINEGQNFTVVVDYAHSPDSFFRLLDAARELGAQRIITVFGCAGETDKGKRPMLTKVATEKSEVVILTTGNPKSENQKEIFDDMLAGVGWTMNDYLQYGDNGRYPVLPNGHRILLHDIRRVAIRAAIAMGKEGDIIFVLARGHESYQIRGDKKTYIDDREVCREALLNLDKLHRAGMDKRFPRMVTRESSTTFSSEVEAWYSFAGSISSL